jgi:hypothetical protein
MAPSLEQVQQWVKAWIVDLDPEVEVQVLPTHDDPWQEGQWSPRWAGPKR